MSDHDPAPTTENLVPAREIENQPSLEEHRPSTVEAGPSTVEGQPFARDGGPSLMLDNLIATLTSPTPSESSDSSDESCCSEGCSLISVSDDDNLMGFFKVSEGPSSDSDFSENDGSSARVKHITRSFCYC